MKKIKLAEVDMEPEIEMQSCMAAENVLYIYKTGRVLLPDSSNHDGRTLFFLSYRVNSGLIKELINHSVVEPRLILNFKENVCLPVKTGTVP